MYPQRQSQDISDCLLYQKQKKNETKKHRKKTLTSVLDIISICYVYAMRECVCVQCCKTSRVQGYRDAFECSI